MNIFEIASRQKFRFPYKGMITTEDLWDLNLNQLDSIYKTLNAGVKIAQEESLLSPDNVIDAELHAKIEIVKHIFNVKRTEAEDRRIAAENAEKKQKILEIVAKKREEHLESMSEDDLLKMLDTLG